MSVPAARHVCNTYYSDTLNPIVQHHIGSYDDLVTRQLPLFLKASNPIKLVLPSEKRSIEIYIGGRDGTHLEADAHPLEFLDQRGDLVSGLLAREQVREQVTDQVRSAICRAVQRLFGCLRPETTGFLTGTISCPAWHGLFSRGFSCKRA